MHERDIRIKKEGITLDDGIMRLDVISMQTKKFIAGRPFLP